MRSGAALALTAALALAQAAAAGAAAAAEGAPGLVDVHFHAHSHAVRRGTATFNTAAAAEAALAVMDRHGIAVALVMPPPFPPDHAGRYDHAELARLVAVRPERFAFLAGGGSLNGMIHATAPDAVTPAVRRRFEETARAILAAGARGFGELTALHLSMRPGHPFEVAAPDHPLFLLLADIAAEAGVPIDLHMEAVARTGPLPIRSAQRGEGDPDRLEANIPALERLLAHNPGAPIIWSHLGWDNTGQRGPRLMRRLLAAHPNLYMSFTLYRDDGDGGGPRAKASRPGGGPGAGQRGGEAGGQRPGRERGGDEGGPLSAGGIKPGWLALLQEFPDRFLIGSDSHVYFSIQDSRIELDQVRELVERLPPPLARRIAADNAKRLFRLP